MGNRSLINILTTQKETNFTESRKGLDVYRTTESHYETEDLTKRKRLLQGTGEVENNSG